jgi:Big-like domain-containing protein
MRHLVLVIALALGVACGSSTGPSEVVTTSGINVTVSNPLRMGQTTQAAGTATLSNGQTQSVTAGWRSDVPAVATATDGGLVAGVANGRATIYVVSGGVQGQQVIRVVPDYHGSWDGGLRVTSCTDSGVFASADACDDFRVGVVSGYALSLDQSGESMSAEASYSDAVNFPAVAVPLQADGRASFTMAATAVISDVTVNVSANFAINSSRVGELTGTVNEVWRLPNISGEMRLAQSIVNTTRSSPTPSGARNAGSPTKFRVLSRIPQ